MKEEILPINLLRFLAALGILFVHKFAYFIEQGYLPHYLAFLTPFSTYGYLGVNLFFLISGFVITMSSEGRTFGQFISARFIRLFPAFWICVSITTLFVIFLSKTNDVSILQYLFNLTMTPSLYSNYDFIDGSYWTLAIELRFYTSIALILLLRSFIKVSLQKIALILSPLLLYHVLYFNPYSISSFDTFLITIFYNFGAEYSQYFLAGILFYGIYKDRKEIYNYIAISACYIVAILVALKKSYPNDKPEIVVFHITLFFIVFLAISLKKITNTSLSFLGNNYRGILITLGAITYPLYLLHSRIINILMEVFTEHNLPPYIASPTLFLIVITIVLLVNKADHRINTYWKQSSVIKNILLRNNITWLKKII